VAADGTLDGAPDGVPNESADGAGLEWIVEAYGCDADALADPDALTALYARLVDDLALHPVGDARWHRFPGTGGVTMLVLLAESHLACHTFPEHGSLCLNLFCCRPRHDWDFDRELRHRFGARDVRVRRLERAYAASVGTA
jgi:S-adenosylmethionine decarboxylase